MNKTNNPLMKTCNHCGLQKPLSSFLQLGPHGTMYGNLCDACRKADKEQKAKTLDTEDGSSSNTGYKIDAKAKVKSEVDKREIRHKVDESYQEDRSKKATKEIRQVKKAEIATKAQKAFHRSFLDKQKVAPTKAQKEEKSILVERAEKEERTGPLDKPLLDTAMGKSKHVRSSLYKQFVAWVGEGSPIGQAAKKASERLGNAKADKTAKDTTDLAKKNWGPKSRGG